MCYHNLAPYNCWGNQVYYYYPLVIEHSYGKLMQIAIDSWFPYQKWWFSIAMLNYQRVWAARSVDPKGWLASGVRECHHSYTMLWKKLTSIKFHKTCTHKYGVFTVTYSIVINCFSFLNGIEVHLVVCCFATMTRPAAPSSLMELTTGSWIWVPGIGRF